MKLKDQNDKVVKSSRLEEDAEIYNKNRSDKLEEGQFQQMTFSQKYSFFKEYYLKYVIIALILVLVSVYVITELRASSKEKDAFYCGMMAGLQFNEETMKAMPGLFMEYLENKTDYDGYISKEDTRFDTFYATYTDDVKLDGYYDQRKFDIFIVRPESFTGYVKGRTVLDLSEVLSPEELAAWDSKIVFVIDPETGSEIPYGILLKNLRFAFQDGGGNPVDPPILCIPRCTKRPEAARLFIHFLLDEEIE